MIFRTCRSKVLLVPALLALGGCFGSAPLHEKDYLQFWCDKYRGEREHRLDDGTRVDCLTDVYAVEVEFAPKWAEAIGQALYYGRMSGRKPGVVLIVRERGDERFVRRLRTVAGEEGIRVWTLRPKDLH